MYLPRHWIISQTAKKVYSVAAIAAVFLWLGVLLPSTVAMELAGGNLTQTPVLRWVLLVVMFVGVLCAALVWGGYVVILVSIRLSRHIRQGCLLFSVGAVGSFRSPGLLYFVYRKSPLLAEQPSAAPSESQAIATLGE
jgi:hypothetical protein